MHRLIIQHVGGSLFVVTQATTHTNAEAVEVPSPLGYRVEGQARRDMMDELRWYLEAYLDYPFEPLTTRAARLLAARRRWGRAAFDALFHSGLGRDLYQAAVREGEDQLTLELRSDDPKVLAWPWEALENPKTSLPLAVASQLERRLTRLDPPPPLSTELSRECLQILLVIARPYAADVGFRSIARPLIELLEARSFPAEVTVLRPPTFEHLQEVLEQNPNTFHILHFDGHGAYDSTDDDSDGPEGSLAFEDEDGQPARVAASELGSLLRRHQLPAVVLNACQAAMLDQHAEDPFASVAAALLHGGVRSVVAMAYSLYVSGAQVFLPSFYGGLFETGDIGRATRDGRRSLFDQRERICARGRHPLEDWMIPVLYQQAQLDFAFVQAMKTDVDPEQAWLPAAADDSHNPYGFVGRDTALLELERAMRREPAALLVHGLSGVGKTTLARGFVKWLAQTHGLGDGVLWLDFRHARSAEYVINEMLEPLVGSGALALPLQTKLDELTRLLKDNALLVVWDNFESARGIEGSKIEGTLAAEAQQLLASLLALLRGGNSKVLLTSRSEERWLGGPQTCIRVLLGGLAGEERWTFCQRILDDLGLEVDSEDDSLVVLIDKLGGHPLLMRAVLPRLESMTAGEIAEAMETNLTEVVDGTNEVGAKLLATLSFVERSLPDELVPLLVPLSLHEHFVRTDDLEAMGAEMPGEWSHARIDALMDALTVAGLVKQQGPKLFELHPALTTYLRERAAQDEQEEAWQEEFVDRMGRVANLYAPRQLHEQRPVFEERGPNFRHALALAKRLKMGMLVAALTQSLASWAQHTRDFVTARTLLEELGEYGMSEGDLVLEAIAYHQLGRVAQEQQDWETAEHWYQKALAVKEKLGDERKLANTYHQLATTAHAQHHFEAAERWHQKALAVFEAMNDQRPAAVSYHNLGIVAQAQRDFEAAVRWYQKSLAIQGKWGDEHGAAANYYQLGRVDQEQGDFESAKRWYHDALAIQEQLGDEPGAAKTYHQLGVVALRQSDFEAAERWSQASLAIEENQGDEHGAAKTYHQLGLVALAQGDFETAQNWFIRAATVFAQTGSQQDLAMVTRLVAALYEGAAEPRKSTLREAWESAGLEWPSE